MLLSPDEQTNILGVIAALELGEEWCLTNLPPFGHIGAGEYKGNSYHDTKIGKIARTNDHPEAIKVKHDRNTIYFKGRVGIAYLNGYIMCRYMSPDYGKPSFKVSTLHYAKKVEL